jgi:hypothetical protein
MVDKFPFVIALGLQTQPIEADVEVEPLCLFEFNTKVNHNMSLGDHQFHCASHPSPKTNKKIIKMASTNHGQAKKS